MRQLTRSFLFIFACLLASSPLHAATTSITQEASTQYPQTRQYVGFNGTWVKPDSSRNIETDAGGVGIFYGVGLSDHFWWETEASIYKFSTNLTAPDSHYFHQYQLMTGLVYTLGDRKSFTPYIIAQVGAIKHDVLPSEDNDTTFGANAGLGLITGPLFDNGLKLRLDARYVYDSFSGNRATNSLNAGSFGDVRVSLGVEFPLGLARVVVREKTVVKTKVETRVETKTIEVPRAVVDTDGDGVPNKRDNCANTLKGAKVDSHGCIINDQTVVLNNILFELGSARLTAASMRNLDRVVDSLKSQQDIAMEIVGNTDSSGSASYNLTLSQQRANSVRDYLISRGVPGDRLTAKGNGETNPVASNASASGRALNRRVELHLHKL